MCNCYQEVNRKYKEETVVVGNCLGLEVIETAVESVYENLPEDRHGTKELVMKNGEGASLQCCDEEEECEDWLKNMLVKAEIVGIEEEK